MRQPEVSLQFSHTCSTDVKKANKQQSRDGLEAEEELEKEDEGGEKEIDISGERLIHVARSFNLSCFPSPLIRLRRERQ